MICRFALAASLLLVPSLSPAQTSGIFADFTTSMGTFTCQLDYTNAPRAVANFISLATGQQPWIDPVTGTLRTNAFFNGLTFHRVITNFMIQGGCPLGTGAGGPGYTYTDEFSKFTFDRAGRLACANSGPDSNGSQFFITVSPQPHLNNVHTIFGWVTSGQTIVDNISKVATDANAMPGVKVIINSIQIRRVGTHAAAFNVNAQGVPVVTNIPVAISKNGTNASIDFPNRLYSENLVYYSSNLKDWSWGSFGFEGQSAQSEWLGHLLWDTIQPRQFFRMTQVRYASGRPVPKSIVGRSVTLEFDYNQGTNTTWFLDSSGGLCVWPSKGLTGYSYTSGSWRQDAYYGRITPVIWGGVEGAYLHLKFLTPTNGTFSGKFLVNTATNCSGVFRTY